MMRTILALAMLAFSSTAVADSSSDRSRVAGPQSRVEQQTADPGPGTRDAGPPSTMISDEAIHEVAAAVVAEQEQRTEMPQRDRRPYWVMYAWLTAATIYDVEATFYRLNHCVECREGNPILRPLVESGRLATYAYSAVLNAAVMYIARRLFDARDPWWRVTPMTFAVVHAIAGTRNLYLGAQGKS